MNWLADNFFSSLLWGSLYCLIKFVAFSRFSFLALAAAAAASAAIAPDITRAPDPSRAECLLDLPQEFVPNVWPALKKTRKYGYDMRLIATSSEPFCRVVSVWNRTERNTELWFYLLFCMGRKKYSGYLRIGCWRGYLHLRGSRRRFVKLHN